MGAWSGRGIPPTRRKLHRFRRALILERAAEARTERAEVQYRDHTWNRRIRKAIVNPERFEELWG